MSRIIMRAFCVLVIFGALLGICQLADAYWAQQRPLYAFCDSLEASPAAERLHVCADQNTTGAAAFRCIARPFKDAHGAIAYVYEIRLLGDETSTCSVAP